MVNDTRSTRKTKKDEVVSSKKKLNDTMSADASGLRRSTRGLCNSSPVNVRKSERLEKCTPSKSTTSVKKKTGNPSPLRRSGRDIKSNSPISKGSPSGKDSKQRNKVSNTPEKKGKQDKTLKEIAEEVREHSKQNSSDEVGGKRKKRLDARHYIGLFKPLKKVKVPKSDSDKKSSPRSSEDSEESCSEKVEEEKPEQCDEEESEGKSATEEKPEHFDEEESEGKSANVIDDENNDVDAEGLNSHGTDNVHVASGRNVSSPSSPKDEDAENTENAEKMPVNVVEKEKHANQEMPSTSNKLSVDGIGLECRQNGMNVGTSAVGSECMPPCLRDDVITVSSPEKMRNLSVVCAKCFRMQRLYHYSPRQELCCCLSSTLRDIDYKDSGQCGTSGTADFVDENAQNVKQSDSPVDVQCSVCVKCKLAGKLLHCFGKGCRQSYHPSCSLNAEENTYLANWYCPGCTKKKLAFGVHSVSQGIESILGGREVDVLNHGGREKQKQCFVKYKGLAHVHNCWVSEAQLLHEAPEHCVKPGVQKEEMQWNPDWAVPHRLLQRRSVVIADHCDKDQDIIRVSDSEHEWLVKWRGLDYNDATWEFEDSSFFMKPEAQRLVEEYEARHNKAKGVPFSGSNELQEKKKGAYVKLGRHSFGGPDSYYLNSVNKLREFHYRGHNAVLVSEQERIAKVIQLISSLVTNVCRPFLIITQHAHLSSWEAEFVRMGVSVNVVVYGGNVDARNMIRSLEFYEEGGQVMFQVLVSSAETVAEDIEELKGIVWEAVIVDDCQQSCILDHSGCMMNLVTGWRLLLINAPLKDNAAEYFKILSLVEPGSSFNQNAGSAYNSVEDIKVLKDRLSSFVICSSFLEYWVPVEISNVQLEQYCYSILSHSSVLRSVLKSDPMGTLRDILIQLRKCCDHPYIVDMALQTSLGVGLSPDDLMDVGVKASGKLYLLEKLLSVFKNLELKVLIIFQVGLFVDFQEVGLIVKDRPKVAGGSGRDATGFVLEDFIRWRFGPDSYEHIASGVVSSKKQAACNQFNSLRERSFFLLETKACTPIIKFSSVDTVIIFNSDWSPMSDLRALQKITIDSKLEQIKVFRFYCPCTIEEKALVLAKNEVTFDSTLQSIIPSISHMLLMWGSSDLFSRLDEFHLKNVSDSKTDIVFGSSLLSDVSEEIISLFQNCTLNDSNKYISVARQSVGFYVKCIPLIGEQKARQEDGLSPLDFWTKLLGRKQPHWKYLSGSSQRNRKRVHYGEASASASASASEYQSDASKKHKKMDSTKMDSFARQAELSQEKLNSRNQEKCGGSLIINSESMANDPSFHHNNGLKLSVMNSSIPGASALEFDNIKFLHDEQRGLIDLLKRSILRLYEVLPLEDDGKRLAEQFLEYLVKNYRVPRKPETTLQALLLSVCWTAAEELNLKIDHKKSLSIARDELGFHCSECEVEDTYSKLKTKMEMYKCLENKNQDLKGDSVQLPLGNLKNTTEELEESLGDADCLKKQGPSPVPMEKDFEKVMKKLERGCNKKIKKIEKHKEELQEFEKCWEERRMKLEKWCKVESAAIRVTHANSSFGIDKLRALDNDYAKKREELEKEIFICRQELEARQQIERDEQKKLAGCVEKFKSLEKLKLLEQSHAVAGVKSQVSEPYKPGKDSNDNASMSRNLPTQQNTESEASKTLAAGRESIDSVLPGYPENSDEQRASGKNDNTSINKNLTSQKNTEAEASKTLEADREFIDSVFPGHPENSDEQRATGHDNSISCPFSMLASTGVDTNALAIEEPGRADLAKSEDSNCLSEKHKVGCAPDSCGKECPSEQPCASEQVEKDTDQVYDMATDRSTALPSNEINRGIITGPLLSPVDSGMNLVTADMTQGLGPKSCNELGEQMLHATRIHNTLTSGETPSSNCSNHVPANPPCNEETSGSTEYAFDERVTRSGNNYQGRVAHDGRLGNLSNGSLGFNGVNTSPVHQDHHAAGGIVESISQPLPPLAADHSVDLNRVQVSVSNSPRVPTPHNADPLQIEVDGIRRDMSYIINSHEQKMLQLKSECEKEIEQVVAQIRSKYDKKLNEAEKAFSLKRNELEIYCHKVMMNKALAEAFRSKCMEYKAAPRMQLGVPSNSVESSPRPPSMRPLASAGSFSATPPAAASPNTALPVRGVRPSTMLGPAGRIPHLVPAAIQQQQARHELRTSAPHIQPFRSASQAISSCSMPSDTVFMAQSPNNPASTSVSQSVTLPPLPAQLNHHGHSPQEESLGLLLSSMSATELLNDISRQNGANHDPLSGNIFPLPDTVRPAVSRDLPQFDGATNLQTPSSINAGSVVWLSDDE